MRVLCSFLFIYAQLYHKKIFLSIFQTYIDKNKKICYNKLNGKMGERMLS